MSELLKKILVYVSFVLGVILIFFILRYIYRLLTDYDPMVKETISNKKNLKNFHSHIGKVTLDSNDMSSSYFKDYRIKKRYGNYINMHLYDNIFDNRIISQDNKGNFYKNFGKIL